MIRCTPGLRLKMAFLCVLSVSGWVLFLLIPSIQSRLLPETPLLWDRLVSDGMGIAIGSGMTGLIVLLIGIGAMRGLSRTPFFGGLFFVATCACLSLALDASLMISSSLAQTAKEAPFKSVLLTIMAFSFATILFTQWLADRHNKKTCFVSD